MSWLPEEVLKLLAKGPFVSNKGDKTGGCGLGAELMRKNDDNGDNALLLSPFQSFPPGDELSMLIIDTAELV